MFHKVPSQSAAIRHLLWPRPISKPFQQSQLTRITRPLIPSVPQLGQHSQPVQNIVEVEHWEMQQGPLRSDNLSCLVTLVESMDQHELCGPFHRLASTSRPFLPVESCESPQGLDRRHEGTMMNRLSVPVILSLAVPATIVALILD